MQTNLTPDHQHGSHAAHHDTDDASPGTPEQDAHLGHEGHDKHEGHSPGMFRDRFWWSLVLSIPVIYFSEMVQEWFGYSAPTFPGSEEAIASGRAAGRRSRNPAASYCRA